MLKSGLALENPWREQRPERDKRGNDEDPWTPFTNAELGAILHALPEGDFVGDLTRIAALTGMRRDEIVQLCNIVEEDGVTCFSVQRGDGKTGNAPRTIPVHSSLAGIVARRHKLNGSLFSDVGTEHIGDTLGKRFSRVTRKSLGIMDPAKVFHSLRKWHMTKLERAGVNPWTAELIQGRSRGTMGLRLYSSGATIKQLKEAIEAVQLPMAEQLHDAPPPRQLRKLNRAWIKTKKKRGKKS